MEHFFHDNIASSKHSGAERILESYANPRLSRILTTLLLFSKLFSLHTIALTREAKLWEDTQDCQGKRRVKCRVKRRPPPGEVGGAKLYRDFTELRWTDHEVTKTVIFEAEAAMHDATSAQVQNAGIWRTSAFPVRRSN